MHSCPHVGLRLATSLCRPLVPTCSSWPVLLSVMNCCHLGPYVYMLIFFHTREPDSCSFLQYGYFSFDKCFPWGLTSSSACTHLRNPQWQEHTLEENIFTSPVAVTIINYLFFCQSSIWKPFWGWGFLPSFVWLDANRAPLGYVTMLMHTWWLQGDKNGPTKVSRSQDSEMNKSYQHQDVACVRVRSETGFTENLKSSRAQGQHSYRA